MVTGFLSTHRNELPGNTALFDLAAAVEWIQRYILYFGGDPNRIVASGQGAGASAATMLSLSGLTKCKIYNSIHISSTLCKYIVVHKCRIWGFSGQLYNMSIHRAMNPFDLPPWCFGPNTESKK